MRDEFDKLISHADFGRILELAGCLKAQKQQLESLTRGQQGVGGSSTAPPSLSLHSRKKQRSEVNATAGLNGPGAGPPALAQAGGVNHRASFDSAAELIRAALIPSAGKEGPVPTMGRGECLITDSLVDETLKSLADELKLCLDLKKQAKSDARPAVGGSGSAKPEASKMSGAVKKAGGRAVAQKHSKRQTDILTHWMIEHREHPFPTQDEIKALSVSTGLTETQVVNWATNVRKRNLKATVEGGKKPHHFLDYLFLAVDREKKMKAAYPHIDFGFLKQFSPQKMSGSGLQQQPPQGQMLQQPAYGYVKTEQPSAFAFGPPPPQHPPTFAYGPPLPPGIPMGYEIGAVVPPLVPGNASNIFRGTRTLKPGISPTTEFAQNERERAVLKDHSAPNLTPPGCFGANEPLDAVVTDVFDAPKEAKAVSFDVNEAMSGDGEEGGEEEELKKMIDI